MASSDGEGDGGRRDEEELRTGPGVVQLPAYSCLMKGAGDAMAGAVMGSVFGFGSGLFQRQGFKGALTSSVSSAKTFALLSGIHGFVTTLLVQIRGRKDAINAGIAGCATGIALSAPGNPAALLQGCATFGVFSYFIERLNTQTATAAPLHEKMQQKKKRNMHKVFEGYSVLPPFTLAPAGLFIFHEPKMHLVNSR